ncbi:hypothetical protein HYW46_07020 [Candidatus Daviesbacteria bacterium]|nr:hypothetical protein [Candidatus Daviesbacteria bacterium]
MTEQQEQKNQSFASQKTLEDLFALTCSQQAGRFMLYLPTLDPRTLSANWHKILTAKDPTISTHLVLEKDMFYAGITGEKLNKPAVFGTGWTLCDGRNNESGLLFMPYSAEGQTYCLTLFQKSQIQKVDFYIPWNIWPPEKLEGRLVQNGLFQGITKTPVGISSKEVTEPWKQYLETYKNILPEEAILGIEMGLYEVLRKS